MSPKAHLSTMHKRVLRLRAFTLVEVLVALLIVALTLSAAINAMQSITQTSYNVQKRTLALWSADNFLKTLRIEKRKPSLGDKKWPCPQGRYAFSCNVSVKRSSSSRFYWVSIHVLDGKHEVAKLVYLIDRFMS